MPTIADAGSSCCAAAPSAPTARSESLTQPKSALRLDRLEAYTVERREIAGPGVGDRAAAKAAIVAFADRPVHADSLQAPAENDAMVTATGNYVVVWKRGEDGNWRLHVDTWNDTPTE